MKALSIFLFSLALTAFESHAQEHIQGRIYIKFESALSTAYKAAPDDAMRMLRVLGMSEMTPVLGQGEVRRLKGRDLPDDLERTYEIRYDSGLEPEFVASKLRGLPGVVYAEPQHVLRTQLAPNDALYGQSGADYFAALNIEQAWNSTISSSQIIIAIVDSGTDFNHPDLAGKLWRNPTPGLAASLSPLLRQVVNDTIGWNFWNSGPINNPEQTANPLPNGSSHGTHVGGLAAANTNNGIGIAGSGFNSSYMVVRVGGTVAEPTSIGYGYPGILYAALNGAHVINCSFGGTNYSNFGADVVKFANSLGSVIIGAAGNTNTETSFYPASFPEVLSVGSVTSGNTRSTFSSYGYDVDVMSRGTAVLSTIPGTNYALNSGTSMASPIVAGIAALVRHKNPTWSPDRVRTQIRASAANAALYSVNNANLAFKLGNGLVDANRAVNAVLPGIQVRHLRFEGPTGRKLSFEENGFIRMTLKNHGVATTSAFTLNAVAMRSGITVTGSLTPGMIASGDSMNISIPIRILSSFDFSQTPQVRLTLTDSGHSYSDYKIASFTNFLFDVVDANRAITSFATNGTIGFESATTGGGGVGFIPITEKNGLFTELDNILYEAGLMVSFFSERGPFVVNQLRAGAGADNHFKPVAAFSVTSPGGISDLDGIARFNSTGFPNAPQIDVKQEVYAFDSTSLNRSIFVKYSIKNASSELMRSVRVGLFADWDIGDYESNAVAYSAPDSILYAFSPNETDIYPYVSIAHLGEVSSVLAIDNAYNGVVDSLNFGTYFSSSDISHDGFTRTEKQWALNAGKLKTSVLNTDIAMATATGPYVLEPGQEIIVGFVMAFGETLPILRAQIAAARARNLFAVTSVGFGLMGPPWIDQPQSVGILPNYPNPFNPGTTIRFTVTSLTEVQIDIVDVLGRTVAEVANRRFAAGEHRIPFDASGLSSGTYLIRMIAGGSVHTRKITLLK